LKAQLFSTTQPAQLVVAPATATIATASASAAVSAMALEAKKLRT